MTTLATAMLDGMAQSERPRMIFDCTEAIRRGVRIAAARTGKSVSDIIMEALQQYIPDDLEQAERTLAKGEQAPKPRIGRRPKSGGEQ